MKTLTVLFLAISLLFSLNRGPSQEPPELQEATTLTDSAIKLFNENKFDEAVSLAKRALEIREKLLPPNDIRISTALGTLGKIYVGKKDYKQAREVFQRLLDIQTQQFGPENLRLADTLDWIAAVQYGAGNSEAAEAAYKRGLAIREKGLGSSHAQVARSSFALAEFYRARGQFQPAVEHYTRALTLYGQLTGVTTPEYEQVSEAFTCLGYDQRKPEVFKTIRDIWKQFSHTNEAEPAQVLNGRALSLPLPNYPEAAKAHRFAGTVVVKVEIDETGKVIGARDMCQGPPFLSEASVAAAWKARFTPTKLSGMPVKVKGIIQYSFVAR
jgi:TonB family protein